MNYRLRWAWVVVAAFLVLPACESKSASGSGSKTESTTSSPATTKAPKTTAPPTTPTTTAPDPAPIALSGPGQQVSKINVTAGLAIFTATHAGAGSFAVELLGATGDLRDVAINVIGAYSGSVGEGLGAGDYQVQVHSDGPWKITVTQPRNQVGAALPHTDQGKQQHIVGPYNCGSAVKIDAVHAGSSNFSVEVLDRDGKLEDVAINDIGDYHGSTISNSLRKGPCWLNVNADGSWSVTVSAP